MEIPRSYKAIIQVSDAWAPQPLQIGNTFLINQFYLRGFKPHVMHILDKCGMNLHVSTMTDITNPHDTHIEKWCV